MWSRRHLEGDLAAAAIGLTWGIVAVYAEVRPSGIGDEEVAGLVAALPAYAALPLRRRWPVPYFGVVSLLGLIAPLVGWLGLVGLFAVAVRSRWTVVLAATLASLAITAVGVGSGPDAPTALGFAAGLTVAVAATGLYVGARRELVASLRERAEHAEADQALRAEEVRAAERRRIAREMHDVLGHRLSLMSVHAGALELRDDLPPAAVRRTANVLRESARAALDDLRAIVLVLREPISDAPQPQLADVPDLVAQSRTAGVPVELTHDVAETPPEQLGRTAYRVVQEGLTNARRHAAGAPVFVAVSGCPGEALTVRIVSGPARSAPAEEGSGTGLIGLRERVALTGGELADSVGADGRHVLSARMPWLAT